ncbi:hypothetical protein FACS1894109_19470 [Spirochaetia bacterium]|nr:hypothetical protein FACS1894109_19470 [Spirochaetia bacterium]
MKELIRIGIFYDGYYFYKVSNYYKYEHEKKARISINGLHNFIRHEIAKETELNDIRLCQIIDAHYFKGRSSAKELGDKVQSERIFEDILMHENIVTHYLPLKYNSGNNSMQEKGIDVWLALEAYELAIYKKFDILVLVAGDGDYVPLVRKLNTLGTQVMLISWDFSYNNENGVSAETRTSRQLLEEVLYPVSMHERIEKQPDSDIVRDLFVTERPYIAQPSLLMEDIGSMIGGPVPLLMEGGILGSAVESKTPAAETAERESIIISVKDGFGFIKDENVNNVFFHYSILTNRDFDELEPGMKVKYLREEDEERSKRDESPRYRATRVTVMD